MGKIRVQWYITLTGIAVAVRRGSCFIPVIRRLSRGLYLSQLLGSGVNHSELFLRLFCCLISSEFLREVGKSSGEKGKGEKPLGTFSSGIIDRCYSSYFRAL